MRSEDAVSEQLHSMGSQPRDLDDLAKRTIETSAPGAGMIRVSVTVNGM